MTTNIDSRTVTHRLIEALNARVISGTLMIIAGVYVLTAFPHR